MGSENNMVAVQQCDRLAAARVYERSCYETVRIQAVQCRNGYADSDLLVLDFARHRLAQPDARQGEVEELRAEVQRLRGLLVDPGSPPWEDARAILVAELRKIGFDTHADNVAAGEGVMLPSYVALNLIALCHRAQQGASSPASGEGVSTEWCMNMARLEEGQEIGAGALDHPLRTKCERPPAGWYCSREPGHDGPCAATPLAAATQPAVAGEGAALALVFYDSGDPARRVAALADAFERGNGRVSVANWRQVIADLTAALTGAGENGEQGA